MGEEIVVGAKAPNFTLPDQNGKKHCLSDYLGKSAVVIFFYPKDFTSVCTIESVAFRDSYDDFRACGAEVFGISQDSEGSHSEFCNAYKLPYKLLADKGNKVRDLYGAGSILGALGARVTFVIDKNGVVRSAYRSALRAKKHVETALAAVRDISEK